MAAKKAVLRQVALEANGREQAEFQGPMQDVTATRAKPKKEQDMREIQRVQVDPEAELAEALKTSEKKRQSQKQIDKATVKQLKAREFAGYLSKKLEGPTEEFPVTNFVVSVSRFEMDVEEDIRGMESNKAVGNDGLHVEIIKVNPPAAASLLTKLWQSVGRTRQVPAEWSMAS